MKDLSKEKIRVLAENNGWSLPRAEGFLDGESFRRRGLAPSRYAQVGFDEYCLGFRAGYYERKVTGLRQSGKLHAPAISIRRNARQY
jgi:hypothetical protein